MNTNAFSIFSGSIFPSFPFRNLHWLAIAFERDNYDNTRIPEWFFREAEDEFSVDGAMLIKGYGENFDALLNNAIELPFSWGDYKNFMLSQEGYSPEYMMVGESGTWACWADGELTVFGGEVARMNEIFDRNGGKDKILSRMEKDFYLSNEQANLELHAYLRELIFREKGPTRVRRVKTRPTNLIPPHGRTAGKNR